MNRLRSVDRNGQVHASDAGDLPGMSRQHRPVGVDRDEDPLVVDVFEQLDDLGEHERLSAA